MPTNLAWALSTVLLILACSSTARVAGRDSGTDFADGSSGTTGAAGSAGNAGSTSGGSAGASGTGALGDGGSSAQGSGGSGGSAGLDSSAGNGGSVGSDGGAESGACVQTDVTVDFAVQGNVQRDKFEQKGVSLVGLANLQLSDRTAAEPDAGLGVVGGFFNWSIDSTEFVTFSFTRPATNVKIYVSHAIDFDNDSVYGKSTVTGYDAAGQQINRFDIAGPTWKNISALFGDVPIAKFTVKCDTDGIAISTLSFTECLD